MRASQLTEQEKPDAFDILNSQFKWVTATVLKSAIKMLSKKPTTNVEDWELDIHQILSHYILRDFSGHAGANQILLLDIWSSSSDNKEPGEFEFYVFNADDNIGKSSGHYPGATSSYFRVADVLNIMKVALAHINKQSLQSLRADIGGHVDQSQDGRPTEEPANKLKNTRIYKKLQKVVYEQFRDDVVDVLIGVNDVDLTMEPSNDPEFVFANGVTDALFYAWSIHVNIEGIRPGCVYDYMLSGSKDLLVQ